MKQLKRLLPYLLLILAGLTLTACNNPLVPNVEHGYVHAIINSDYKPGEPLSSKYKEYKLEGEDDNRDATENPGFIRLKILDLFTEDKVNKFAYRIEGYDSETGRPIYDENKPIYNVRYPTEPEEFYIIGTITNVGENEFGAYCGIPNAKTGATQNQLLQPGGTYYLFNERVIRVPTTPQRYYTLSSKKDADGNSLFQNYVDNDRKGYGCPEEAQCQATLTNLTFGGTELPGSAEIDYIYRIRMTLDVVDELCSLGDPQTALTKFKDLHVDQPIRSSDVRASFGPVNWKTISSDAAHDKMEQIANFAIVGTLDEPTKHGKLITTEIIDFRYVWIGDGAFQERIAKNEADRAEAEAVAATNQAKLDAQTSLDSLQLAQAKGLHAALIEMGCLVEDYPECALILTNTGPLYYTPAGITQEP